MTEKELKKLTNALIHNKVDRWIETYPDKFVVHYAEQYHFMINVKFTMPWRLRINYRYFDIKRKYIYLGMTSSWALRSSYDRKKTIWESGSNVTSILKYYSDMHRIWE